MCHQYNENSVRHFGSHNQYPKVVPRPTTINRIYRRPPRFNYGMRLPTHFQVSCYSRPRTNSYYQSQGFHTYLPTASGTHGSDNIHRSQRKTTFPMSSTLMYAPHRHDVHRMVAVPSMVKQSLTWWTIPHNMLADIPFHWPQSTMQITTDASVLCWGAHMQDKQVQGRWSAQESLYHINLLELRAVSSACEHFFPLICNQVVHILTDNMTTVYYISRQGGACSHSLCIEAILLWNWCNRHNVIITAAYFPEEDNITTDALSRHFVQQHEWELHTDILHLLFNHWGYLSIDLFATQYNAKCAQYYSRAGIVWASKGDAFLYNWSQQLLYAFPPIPLIPKVLEKVAINGARVILVAPFWPRQTWFPYLFRMSPHPPYHLPSRPDLLTQDHGQLLHHSWITLLFLCQHGS
ncbi:uncharacterized protein LOC142831042 [Pelodiscus sinensis]|uniref:uncharacterized protein LOC142831042 n=1 Tax=Pelodiscus sinensis TaxID=13735 RepID=UPI003F6CBEFA